MVTSALPARSPRISEEQQLEICRLSIRQVPRAEIARRVGVNRHTVRRVLERSRAALRINSDLAPERAEALVIYRERRERAERLKRGHEDFFDRYGPEARDILGELLDKYAEHGVEQFKLPDVLKVPPISGHGNPSEIARAFGGAVQLRKAVDELQELLYAA